MEASRVSKFRIVVAGQLPPPVHGQAIYIEQTLKALSRYPDLQVEHLEFKFSRSMSEIRQPSARKILEAVRIAMKLLHMRFNGPIDLMLYPAGGPHTVPLLRDLLLLPLCLILSRRLVLNFHATGVAEALPKLPHYFAKTVVSIYRRARGALVLTEAGRSDAEATGIRHIEVVPNGLPDAYDSSLIEGRSDATTILYAGHLCPDKGTHHLLEAVGLLHKQCARKFRLVLLGEPSPPWTSATVHEEIVRRGITDIVSVEGVQTGTAKWKAFANADIFAFPSTAPYEGFPLVLLEAMMWKLPIVTTRWKGIPEVVGVDGGATLLDPATLPHGLAAALQSLLQAPQTLPERGEANRQRYLKLFAAEIVHSRLHEAILSFLIRE